MRLKGIGLQPQMRGQGSMMCDTRQAVLSAVWGSFAGVAHVIECADVLRPTADEMESEAADIEALIGARGMVSGLILSALLWSAIAVALYLALR